MDQIFTDIAEQVPGFGGFFLDENGDLILFVTDLTRGMAAEQAARDLLESLDPRERPHVHQFRVRKGDYDFRDLLEWRYGLSSVLTIPGVVFTDVDEGLNRVRVGIDNPIAAQSVLQMALSTGIPLNALVIEDVGPLRTLSTLQDSVRPMEGGIRISSDNHQCTLGFLAERNQVLVFITNSHCTDTQGGVEGTIFAQPSATDENVGLEQVDPAYTALPACAPSTRCRESDSASFVSYQGVDYLYGHIYRTESFGSSSGSTTIDGTFPIEAEATVSIQGDTLNKMGSTTGWTRGPVTGTCIDVTQFSGITIACDDIVAAGVSGGDSGAAVFSWDPSESFVILHGIAHSGGSSQFVFSPIDDIESELGSLITQTLE